MGSSMKHILGLSLILASAIAISSGDRSINNNGTHFFTNSYMHTDERPYPIERPGHSRAPAFGSCSESPDCRQVPHHTRMEHMMKLKMEHHAQCLAAGECPRNRPHMARVNCENGMAGNYECNNIDLLSFVPIAQLGSTYVASDSWGWADPETGDEIAIIGLEDGTAFVQMTDAVNPIVLGFLPQSGKNLVIWSDMKVFANHVFIVRESDSHGMQVMDLTKLREYYGKPSGNVRQLTQDAFYDQITSTHNVVINEQTGFAYLVGTRTCSGGLHVVDINEPLNPTYAGCFSDDGYTHDAQCVMYHGPDSRYKDHEICFNFNEDTLTIVDVSDKANMKMLSRVGYDQAFYTHQGWVTEDQKYVMMNDEADEVSSGNPNTRTLLWTVEDLENPMHLGSHFADTESIDHNLYIKGDLGYLANYCSGLRILDATQMMNAKAPELAFFDACDYCDSAVFEGVWSNYPFFDSGNVVLSSVELGLFILRPKYNQIETDMHRP